RRLPAPIFVGASEAMGARIAEEGSDLPGIGIEMRPMRYDTNTTDFTHLLGRVWGRTKDDDDRFAKLGRTPPEYVGKDGLEWFYEPDLMGKAGTKEIEVDAKKHPVRVVGWRDSPTPGTKLELSVDSNLQSLAANLLATAKLKNNPNPVVRGAVVAIDPSTGEVLCLASTPTYDLKKFEHGISKIDYAELTEDDNHPFINRCITPTYAPGSTFKIITSLAMQESGIFNTSTTVYCDGAFHMKKARLKCLGHHGQTSYLKALKLSCNTYFCTMGTRVKIDALAKAAREMGLGEPAGLDVRNDVRSGVVPDPEYKAKHELGKWFEGDTANTAVGQGYVAVSPLQMADVVAMVANRGVMYRPHLVHAKGTAKADMVTVSPEVTHRVDAPDSFWSTLIEGLHMVVGPGGTAEVAEIPGLDWAGKTGSAEHSKDEQTHSWFVGFAPLDHPKIAIAVLVEGAGHGATVAAPIAREIVKAYLFPANARVNSSSAP
ncbi:MAG TPA: penicillin-binding transpeptidase domain-containing protein, partial [Fimbriimonadaceae bacterium]|nr:penicillin-binding transpeptidase domain-containing protein [Fimbriimonadaceae bacterium]